MTKTLLVVTLVYVCVKWLSVVFRHKVVLYVDRFPRPDGMAYRFAVQNGEDVELDDAILIRAKLHGGKLDRKNRPRFLCGPLGECAERFGRVTFGDDDCCEVSVPRLRELTTYIIEMNSNGGETSAKLTVQGVDPGKIDRVLQGLRPEVMKVIRVLLPSWMVRQEQLVLPASHTRISSRFGGAVSRSAFLGLSILATLTMYGLFYELISSDSLWPLENIGSEVAVGAGLVSVLTYALFRTCRPPRSDFPIIQGYLGLE